MLHTLSSCVCQLYVAVNVYVFSVWAPHLMSNAHMKGVINYFVVCYENEEQCISCAVECYEVAVNASNIIQLCRIASVDSGCSVPVDVYVSVFLWVNIIIIIFFLLLFVPSTCNEPYIVQDKWKAVILCECIWYSLVEPNLKAMDLDAMVDVCA